MTGGAFNDPAQERLRTLPNPLLEKPFDAPALHAVIARVLEDRATSGTWLKAAIEQAV